MRVFRVALCIVFGATLATATQAPTDYRAIVNAYRHDQGPALRALLTMPPADVNRAVADASTARSGWTAGELEAAIVMNTDAGFTVIERRGDTADAWLNAARTLADAAVTDEHNLWFVARWYQGVVVALNVYREPAKADAVTRRFRQQPWFHIIADLQRGRQLERDGNAKTVTVALGLTDTTIYDPPAFRQAIPYLKSLVDGHPALRIAAVHLGRIQMLRGRDLEARRLFEEGGRAGDASTRYYADLLLGSLEEREGHPGAAEARYRAALGASPGAQSGRLALATFLARRARGAEAAAVLDPPAPQDPARRFDPWSTYFGDVTYATAGSVLAELRAEITQ